jgi:hypothetical protein
MTLLGAIIEVSRYRDPVAGSHRSSRTSISLVLAVAVAIGLVALP